MFKKPDSGPVIGKDHVSLILLGGIGVPVCLLDSSNGDSPVLFASPLDNVVMIVGKSRYFCSKSN